jgi:metalloendopeptidase OMA1, mitochondrial
MLPDMKRVMLSFLAAAVVVPLFTACNTVAVTGRRQLNIYSPAEEMQLGLASFTQMKQEQKVSKDPAGNALLTKVGKKIAAIAQPDMPDAQWEFVLFDSPEANAFCLPGGKVGVYTGILPITKDETGLAVVLGHEIAHAVAHHGGERMTTAAGVQALGQIGSAYASAKGVSTENLALAQQLYGVGAQVGAVLPHSRAQESEADHIGLIYMARAGYDPEAAVAFWQRFADYAKNSGGGSTPWFLRTHPLDETRISQLKGWMSEAKAQMPK